MSGLQRAFEWTGPSTDPNDEQFGDVVEAASVGNADNYDAVLVGEPYDGAVIGRRGAAEGPAALREALAGVKTHHFDAGPVGRVADLGDVTVPDGDVREVQTAIRETTRRVHAADALPVFLGGDNSLTYPNAHPLLGSDSTPDTDSLGVVNLDAHLDVRELQDGPTSGTPYRQLFEDGLDAYACVGARHFETSTAYHDYLRERGGAVVTAEEVAADPVAAADAALEAVAGVDAVYVSVDLDVLGAAHAPGVSAPTPGGLAPTALFRTLRLLAGGLRGWDAEAESPAGSDADATADSSPRFAGFEVVECAPPLDEGDRTSRAGARAVAHLLAAAGVGAGGVESNVGSPDSSGGGDRP